MDKNHKDRVIVHAKFLFESLRYLKESEYEICLQGIIELRKLSLESDLAPDKLRQLIYDEDGAIRIISRKPCH